MEPGNKPTTEENDQDSELLSPEELMDAALESGAEGAQVSENSELDAAQARCAELEQTVLRVRADMDNLRKRNYREIENARKFALERFMADLLDINDSLERGLEASDGGQVSIEGLREGAELTMRQLNNVLGKHGLTEINPKGESFNPEHHEAISLAPVDGVESGSIIEVVQKGYLLNDRLLRPARVVVAQ